MDRRARLVALYGTAALVAALLLAPPDATPDTGRGIPHLDKAVHAALFAGLGALAVRAHPATTRPLLLAALAAYGGALELAQAAVPGRAPDAVDLVADAAGAAAGLWLIPGRSTTSPTAPARRRRG